MQSKDYPHLHNCPFCSGEPTLCESDGWFYIVCGDCGTCSDHVSAEEIAVRIWNTRPEEDRLNAENERLKSDLTIQKNLTKQMCFECNRRDNEINLLKNTIAGFRTGVRFMSEEVNFGSRATKAELHKRLSMVFAYLGIMKAALKRLDQTENGEDAPDMDDGRKTETNEGNGESGK